MLLELGLTQLVSSSRADACQGALMSVLAQGQMHGVIIP